MTIDLSNPEFRIRWWFADNDIAQRAIVTDEAEANDLANQVWQQGADRVKVEKRYRLPGRTTDWYLCFVWVTTDEAAAS